MRLKIKLEFYTTSDTHFQLTRCNSEPTIADVWPVNEVADWSDWSLPICTFFPVLGSTIFNACFCRRGAAVGCCWCSEDDGVAWWGGGGWCCMGWVIIDGGGPPVPPPP